mgnify:CR=1 FL=1
MASATILITDLEGSNQIKKMQAHISSPSCFLSSTSTVNGQKINVQFLISVFRMTTSPIIPTTSKIHS